MDCAEGLADSGVDVGWFFGVGGGGCEVAYCGGGGAETEESEGAAEHDD